MATELLIGAQQISDALGELTREIARNVVLVRGSMGSSGSGVIWDRPGLVITNHHVVPGPRAELTVAGGRRLKARVVRRAPALDLAALEVEGDPRQGAHVGDSDELHVGGPVLPLGNPMGD